jgi:hypothetical protein
MQNGEGGDSNPRYRFWPLQRFSNVPGPGACCSDMKVIQTEPTLQKATASAVMKPATLETGLVVNVPPFVNEGDRIRVDTSEARYVQRVE